MNIQDVPISALKPYENNPRRNDDAVDAVAKSIETFGFKVPLVIDKDNVIVCGHTRYKAAVKLELQAVPCIIADDLTPEQIRAFRLVDNKTNELSGWDFEKLDAELAYIADLNDEIFNVDMTEFGFADTPPVDWDRVEDLTEESYKEPAKTILKCPKCGHEAGKSFFRKV